MLRKLLNRLLSTGRAPVARGPSPAPREESADRLIADGNRAEGAGRVQEACERYREAVQAAPDYAKAHLNLGIGLEAAGATEPAIRSYESALAIDPSDPFAAYNLGKLLYTRGVPEEAERLLRQALQNRPGFPEAQVVLSQVLESQGNLGAAAAALETAMMLRPDDFGALYLYAGVLWKQNRLDEAQGAFKRAIAIDPENTDANYALATLFLARGRPGDAVGLLRTVLKRDPHSVDAHARLFEVYDSRGDLPAAAAEIEAVLSERPDWADALFNYGCVLKKLMRLTDAESAFRRALAADPGHVRAYRMLGGVLLGQCRTDEALALYRTARERLPDDFDLESAELFALNSSEQIAEEELFTRHAAFGTRIEQAHPPRFKPFRNARDPERRLRIGYVSGDFCYHVVTLFTLPVIERHDRSAFEVYCYSTGGRVDEYTRQLSARADVWRDVSSLPESGLADEINRDGIDILVDLGGHSGIPQLAVFAQQPAPVQATWLGYLNTTGLTRIHYRISDRHADPPGLTDPYHTETLVRLPHSQWCFRPFISVACAEMPPFVRNGHVTFGSFNQALKISSSVRRLWAEILQRVPGSRLVILGVAEGRARDQLVTDLTGSGSERARITVLPYVSLQDYYNWLNAVDIALDTVPYSGGTTSCDALWMGVPVVTAPGSRPSSRSTASILSTAGLPEWIASSPEDYVRLAAEFARDEARLVGLRKSLRERLRRSPLMDEERFVRDVEAAYRQKWRKWCESGERGR
jgi:predicted O-linked N-acetylglucosamine transferase (SPINDLY family)